MVVRRVVANRETEVAQTERRLQTLAPAKGAVRVAACVSLVVLVLFTGGLICLSSDFRRFARNIWNRKKHVEILSAQKGPHLGADVSEYQRGCLRTMREGAPLLLFYKGLDQQESHGRFLGYRDGVVALALPKFNMNTKEMQTKEQEFPEADIVVYAPLESEREMRNFDASVFMSKVDESKLGDKKKAVLKECLTAWKQEEI